VTLAEETGLCNFMWYVSSSTGTSLEK